MIVVKLEMWPKGDESRKYELGRTYIYNAGGTTKRGDYEVRGTPLDTWIGGGLPSGGLVQVRGPQGVGKSTFLLALAEGIHGPGAGGRLVTVVPPRDTRLVSSRSELREETTVEGVHRQLNTVGYGGVLLVDQTQSYGAETKGLARVAQAWTAMLSFARDRGVTVVMAGTERWGLSFDGSVARLDGRFAGRAADYGAKLIIGLEPVARTDGHPGMVVEASLLKSRRNPPSTPPVLLWLRPGHVPPMIFA